MREMLHMYNLKLIDAIINLSNVLKMMIMMILCKILVLYLMFIKNKWILIALIKSRCTQIYNL